MSRLLLAGLLLASFACTESTTDAEAGNILALRSGTSFGMCAGYCMTELSFDSTTVSLTETSRDPRQSPRTRSLLLTANERQRIQALVDERALESLAGVHGCPDCADGGAEWIELRTTQSTVRVTFEYGRVLDPIGPLQAEIRALRERLRVNP